MKVYLFYNVRSACALLVFFLSSIVLIQTAFPQTDCSSAIAIPITRQWTSSYHYSGSETFWGKFTADTNNLLLYIRPKSDSSSKILSITIYTGTCGQLVYVDNKYFLNQDSIFYRLTALSPNHLYYFKLTSIPDTNCSFCNFSFYIGLNFLDHAINPENTEFNINPCLLGPNLLTNGDFNNVGFPPTTPAFQSDYQYVNLNVMGGPGLIAIGENAAFPYTLVNSWIGTGLEGIQGNFNFLLADCKYTNPYAGVESLPVIWESNTINCELGKDYYFNFSLLNIDDSSTYAVSEVMFLINDFPQNFINLNMAWSIFVDYNPNNWITVYGFWTCQYPWDINTKLKIVSRCQNVGCDIGIDRIHFGKYSDIVLELGNNENICNNDSTTIEPTIISQGMIPCTWNYTWSTGDTTNIIIVHPSITTSYYLTVSCGSISLVDSITIYVQSSPFCNTTSNSPVCTKETLQLYGSGGAQYNWSGPVGWTSNVQSPAIQNCTIYNNGIYYLTVTDSNGCTATDTIHVTVYPGLNIYASNSSPTCEGSYLNLYSGGGLSYLWSGPSSFTSTIQNPYITNPNFANAGLYHVTITDANNCTDTASTEVWISSKLVTEITGNSPVCSGNSLQLTASGGFYNFWLFPNDSMSWEQNPLISPVSPAHSGWYYVYITDYTGVCSAVDSIEIVVLQSAEAAIASNSPVCKGDTISLTASGGTTYFWTGPSGFTSSQQNISLANSAELMEGLYTVLVSNNNGCDDSVSDYVNVVNCCDTTGIPAYMNQSVSQIINNLPIKFAISGTLVIDQSSSFDAKEIIMLPGSMIDIPPGINFKVSNCHLYGCDTMWQTINVQPNGLLQLRGSIIEDAEYAITLADKSILNLTDNTFHANNVGVYMPAPTNWYEYQNMVLPEFQNNDFNCENDLLIFPHEGEIGYCGILLNNVTAFTTGKEFNSFRYLRNGIRAFNTTMKLDGLFFQHITDSIGSSGCGIYANSSKTTFLTQTGFGKFGDFSFDQCKYGIYALNQHLFISENNMNQMEYGITEVNSPYTDLNINYNQISASTSGITLLLNDPVNSGFISNNDILMNSRDLTTSSIGLLMWEFNNPPLDTFQIRNNYIQNDTSGYGIYLASCNRIEMSENSVILNKPIFNNHGISFINCRNANVFCNSVFGLDTILGNTAVHTPRGMFVQETYNSKFSCNSFDGTKVGLSFNNNCHDALVRGNKFYDLTWGLHYNNYGVTGPQIDGGNKWVGGYTLGAFHQTIDANIISLSKYYVKSTFSLGWPPSIFPSPILAQWFYPSDTSPTQTFNCNQPVQFCTQPDTLLPLFSNLSTLDYSIALGINNPVEYEQEIKWLTSRFLFNKLLADTLLLNSDTIMQNFYDTIQDASAGRYQQTENAERAALTMEPVSKHLIDSLNQQIRVLIDSMQTVNVLFSQPHSTNDSIFYVQLLMNLNTILGGKVEDLQSVINGISTLINNNINLVKTEYGVLPSSEIYEQNEQMINDIYLESRELQTLNFTNLQRKTIREIACQCPLAGGNAVYLARSLYAVFADTTYDDRQLCLQAGINYKYSLISREDEAQFKLYPNPATTTLTIVWDHVSDEKVTYSVVNTLGQLLMEENISLNSGSYTIDLKNFISGIYEVKLSTFNKTLKREKLIIIR